MVESNMHAFTFIWLQAWDEKWEESDAIQIRFTKNWNTFGAEAASMFTWVTVKLSIIWKLAYYFVIFSIGVDTVSD